ncbi:tail fiber assembly protein [Enterobacter bugandensis]|uniref:tail fiber assembly protein n=1 Tax=Enterobacter bugandensis TaxID=881260 RepID=UPI0013DFD996|nr:tail fiber assembly protein [Enterobacter bugandensis]
MVTFKKFSIYSPDYILFDAIYLQSEDGLDWYYHRTRFQDDSFKICFDDQGVIRMFGQDAQLLWPDGLSVVEVSVDEVPSGLDGAGNWQFIDGKIVPRTYTEHELKEIFNSKRSKLLLDTSSVIDPLNDAVELNIATQKEIDSLVQWKEYRVKLMRLNFGDSWPEEPAKL